MGTCSRIALSLVIAAGLAGTALAQQQPPPQPQVPQPPQPQVPQPPQMPQQPQPPQQPQQPGMTAPAPDAALAAQQQPKEKKQPKRGDFDAGGKVRLPNGPDEMGQYATFNWVAVDAKGTYYLLDTVTIGGTMPIALIKPDSLMTGEEPGFIGGFTLTLDARLPQGPFAKAMKYETEVRLLLTGAYMREGVMLLSDKDFPLFVGDFQPGFSGGLDMKVKLSTLVDFKLAPVWVTQATADGSYGAVQIPMSLVLAVGEVAKLHADLGVYTGPDYAFGADDGGRITAGGALTLKIGPLMLHGGAGVASLLTGGMYPTVRDSFYVDLNVKYVK